MTPIEPEIAGALIGVGAMSGAWAVRHGFEFLRYKLNGNGKNGKCSSNGHCKDHTSVMHILQKLQESHEDEKQVELMVKAIKNATGGFGFRMPDSRD